LSREARQIDEPMTGDAPQLLARLVMPGVGRALALMDLDSTSPTYGSMDRSFWHYRTLVNFPGAVWQQPMVAFAALHATPHPTNPYAQGAQLRDTATAALVAWSRSQHRDGAFDEWYRNEHSYCATAITTAGAVITLDLLGSDAAGLPSQLMVSVGRAAEWLASRYNPAVMNQNLAAAVALAGFAKVCGDAVWRARAASLLTRIAKDQSPEGWFPEYGGFDFGYSTLALDFLALAEHFGLAEVATPMAERLIAFLLDTIDADRPVPARLGSRGTGHVFPAGALSFAGRLPAAAVLANRLLSIHSAGLAPDLQSVDDRYFAYFYFPALTLAYRAACTSPLSAADRSGEASRAAPACVIHPHSGIVVRRMRNAAMFTSRRLGGAVALTRDLEPPFYHCGYTVTVSNGRRFSSAGWQSHDGGVHEPGERLVVTARFRKVSGGQPLRYLTIPFQIVVHFLVFSRIAELFQMFVKDRMIVSRSEIGLVLERQVAVSEEQVVLRDRLIPDGRLPIVDIQVTDAITMHSPSARQDAGETCRPQPELSRRLVQYLSAGKPATIVWRFSLERARIRSEAHLDMPDSS
jgi:hypothetical protein